MIGVDKAFFILTELNGIGARDVSSHGVGTFRLNAGTRPRLGAGLVDDGDIAGTCPHGAAPVVDEDGAIVGLKGALTVADICEAGSQLGHRQVVSVGGSGSLGQTLALVQNTGYHDGGLGPGQTFVGVEGAGFVHAVEDTRLI